jgi:hypothetical protein
LVYGNIFVSVFIEGRVDDIAGMLFLEGFFGSIDSRFEFGRFDVSKA